MLKKSHKLGNVAPIPGRLLQRLWWRSAIHFRQVEGGVVPTQTRRSRYGRWHCNMRRYVIVQEQLLTEAMWYQAAEQQCRSQPTDSAQKCLQMFECGLEC